MAQDGMVYVNDNRKKDDGVTASVYRINPSKLKENLNFDKILYPSGLTACKTDGHPRAISMAVLNDGNTQKLYVLNAYRRSYVNGSYSYHPHLHRWTLNGTDIGKQEKADIADVIAIVRTVSSPSGHTCSTDSRSWRIRSFWWVKLRPIRRYLLAIYNRLPQR
jgi:hypothetical protein